MDVEEFFRHPRLAFPVARLKVFLLALLAMPIETRDELQRAKAKLSKRFYIMPNNHDLNYVLNHHLDSALSSPRLARLLMVKGVRSSSGVSPITVVLAPHKFSCGHNCYYCPDERVVNGAKQDMPRSYASSEPAVMRAIEVEFDAVRQVYSRLTVLSRNGHPIDKLEYILEGGTFSNYPKDYAREFMRDLYYAANIWPAELRSARPRESLEEEQRLNEYADAATPRVIGVVVETRPDYIRWPELRRFRELGVTRVQIGVQHTDDDVLEYINRGHTYEDSKRAVDLLKRLGFKVDVHVMPDLPGTTPEKDRKMLVRVIKELAPDYMKVYPCLDVTFTEIRKWKETGKWKPYAETEGAEPLIQVLLEMKRHIPPFLRINRLQRDFPNETDRNDHVGYLSDHIKTNLRQILHQRMAAQNERCLCIRCREIGEREINHDTLDLQVYPIDTQGHTEYFISIVDESQDALVGLCRLRIPNFGDTAGSRIPELYDAAIIRELHVYGRVRVVGAREPGSEAGQHHGFGRRLVERAEDLALYHGMPKMAIISGIGVRGYYRKLGYELEGTYMVKRLY